MMEGGTQIGNTNVNTDRVNIPEDATKCCFCIPIHIGIILIGISIVLQGLYYVQAIIILNLIIYGMALIMNILNAKN